jgi:hypothetical protein
MVSVGTVGKGRKLLSDGVVLLEGGGRLIRNDAIYDGCFGFPTVWFDGLATSTGKGREEVREEPIVGLDPP